MKIPFHEPPKELDKGLDALNAAYRAGHASNGPEIDIFEYELAKYWGVNERNVVTTLSCTSAIEIACRIFEVSSAAVPALTWNATANAVEHAEATPIMIDVDDFGCMSAQCLDKILSERGMLDIVAVHLYGNALDADVFSLAREYNRKLIIDAAQAFEFGHMEGSDATCFSFHALKSLPLGIGGAIVFDDVNAAEEARKIRYHGVSGSARVQTTLGYKHTIPAPAAAMGIELLKYVDRWHGRRKEIVKAYKNGLEGIPKIPRCGTLDACHAFVVLPINREKFISYLTKNSIGCMPFYEALTNQPYWSGQRSAYCAEEIGNSAVAIPLYPTMNDQQVEKVIETIRAYDW